MRALELVADIHRHIATTFCTPLLFSSARSLDLPSPLPPSRRSSCPAIRRALTDPHDVTYCDGRSAAGPVLLWVSFLGGWGPLFFCLLIGALRVPRLFPFFLVLHPTHPPRAGAAFDKHRQCAQTNVRELSTKGPQRAMSNPLKIPQELHNLH